MTHAPAAATREVHDVESACAVLREGGGRVSAARRAILEVLHDADAPLTADDVARRAARALDVPSTYRNLDRLGRAGLVRHVHLGHGPGRYVWAARPHLTYAHCEGCETTVTVDPARLAAWRDEVLAAVGIRPDLDHFALVGRCATCLANPL